jgi:hypothetical protein
MNLTEIESRPEERCNSIRFDLDSIQFRSDADLVPIVPNFKLVSVRLYFNSIRFDFAPPVTLLLLLIILLLNLFNLFVSLYHRLYVLSPVVVSISNKYRTSMPLGEPPSPSLFPHYILISLIA